MIRHNQLSVAYAMAWYDTSGGAWTKIGLRSFRKYFPTEELIVVHNNHRFVTPELYDIVLQHASIVTERIFKSRHNPHGRAIDLAVQICRRRNYDILILIEPDCLFKGRMWSNNLIMALYSYKLAGINRFTYGPIHPGISAWWISEIPGSFNAVHRSQSDPVDGRFTANLYNWLGGCVDENCRSDATYHIKWWDTGLLNSAIVDDEACIVDGHDVTHFGGAYARTPYYYANHADFGLIKDYIY